MIMIISKGCKKGDNRKTGSPAPILQLLQAPGWAPPPQGVLWVRTAHGGLVGNAWDEASTKDTLGSCLLWTHCDNPSDREAGFAMPCEDTGCKAILVFAMEHGHKARLVFTM